jgi:hypothetical protein
VPRRPGRQLDLQPLHPPQPRGRTAGTVGPDRSPPLPQPQPAACAAGHLPPQSRPAVTASRWEQLSLALSCSPPVGCRGCGGGGALATPASCRGDPPAQRLLSRVTPAPATAFHATGCGAGDASWQRRAARPATCSQPDRRRGLRTPTGSSQRGRRNSRCHRSRLSRLRRHCDAAPEPLTTTCCLPTADSAQGTTVQGTTVQGHAGVGRRAAARPPASEWGWRICSGR